MQAKETRIELPKDVAETIKHHLANVRHDWADNAMRVGEIAASVRALPLTLDFGGFCGLQADGTFVEVLWDSPGEVRALGSARIRDIALKVGSERYPVLATLLPARPAEAHVCPHCGGSGIHPLAAAAKVDNLVCWCGGLGWIPEEWDEAPPGAVGEAPPR